MRINKKLEVIASERSERSNLKTVIAEPVPSEARNLIRLRVCFGFASQPLRLLAMTIPLIVATSIIFSVVIFYPKLAFAAASISLTGGAWDIGTKGASSESTSSANAWTITNDSGGTEDVLIKVASTLAWTASIDGTQTANQFVLRKDSSIGQIITGTDGTLVSSLANAGTNSFGLYFKTPPTGSEEGSHTLTVTLTATNWVFACGSNVTFTYRGSSVTYGTVSSQGKCWMDRNLGASQVATAYNDSAAYGDLFQWGRLDDSHQSRTSGTTSTLATSDVPGHSNFIVSASSPYDWRSPQNDALWQGVSGTNNPCPTGWRIATEAEWTTEKNSWGTQDYNGAFASPLKLTAAGYRAYDSAALSSVGSYGAYWSSTVSGTFARLLRFDSGTAGFSTYGRAFGFSVRCFKN